jgi:O-glycosyl hydrolase
MSRRRLASICVVASALLAAAPASAATTIRVDGTAPGRTFDGVGASSGGGGSARYLIDYPEPARTAILDYLFRPGYGAAVQVLKVEIGGDGDSTEGAEPSIEHTRGRVDCDAGYEWWLMEQAKARNPAIRLYALAWGAPGWTRSFKSSRTIAYLVDWLRCARRHGLRIDYLSGNQNERSCSKRWVRRLRAALDATGFAGTRIVVPEQNDFGGTWPLAERLARDRRFDAAASVIGEHDVCGYPTDGLRCRSTRTARRLGKPLWAAELGGLGAAAGAPNMARAMIRGYPQARLVAYIAWPLITAIPPGLPHERTGLVYAREPWSGNYHVNAMSYALAMMTWFTAPGWRYVDGAGGGFGGPGGYARGGYTTLRAPQGRDWSTIAETTTATVTQHVRFAIGGGLAATTVHVWRTRLSSPHPRDWMVRRRDVHPVHGRFRFGLRPGYVYTLTTLARHAKGTARPPRRRPFGAYVDRPDANPLDDMPAYLAPMDGAFEHAPCMTRRARTCIQQMAPRAPVAWRRHAGFPYAVIGDGSLRDYTVSSDVRLAHPGSSAGVLARFSHRGRGVRSAHFRGYVLALRATGAWQLLKNDPNAGVSVLRSGRVVRRPRWRRISLTAEGPVLTARIDGRVVASARDGDRRYASGIAGIEAGATETGGRWTGTSWPAVQYRKLRVIPR